MRWQLIETAPKDETEILIFCPSIYGNEYHVARWNGKIWRGSVGEGCESWVETAPTHWMPLPENPYLHLVS